MIRYQTTDRPPLADAPSFIEVQFPVAKVSMESYKERKSNYSQTLTGLGKWWGRKPLVLVRAALLGLLLPATDDPQKDLEIFLKLMTMDDAGLQQRFKTLPSKRLLQELLTMPPGVQERFLDPDAPPDKPRVRRLAQDEREELKQLVFERMSYDEKLRYCDRPEQIDGPSAADWEEINAHLGTHAAGLPELVTELGELRFGHRPRVGDAFCGGGSIPFEAARLGCDAYGSDLNPVAALLTWAALHVAGCETDLAEALEDAQQHVFDIVDRQITTWGIEHNSLGWRADAYIYCSEVIDPESGWAIPLAPNWVIGESGHIAKLVPDESLKRYTIEIYENVSKAELKKAKETGTVQNSRLIPPNGEASTPIEVLRRDMRQWENEDLVPRPDDVFQERLYCIRWVETYIDEKGRERTRRHYRAPTPADMERETKVLALLKERFYDWQAKGYIPSLEITPGQKTDEPIRTRGWTHWHHLFTPRQLLTIGLFSKAIAHSPYQRYLLPFLAKLIDNNCKLVRWKPSQSSGSGGTANTFSNQALNTLYNFAVRCFNSFDTLKLDFGTVHLPEHVKTKIHLTDSREITTINTIWITDPPYADAVIYHELSELFLAWYEKHLEQAFPSWYADSKRALAIQGSGYNFRQAMMESYHRMAQNMPDNGMQIVMFTHQDAAVWADLTMILWAAGLRVTAAWTIATETDSALRQGNYVQGTVLLVLRKRIETEPVFLDEITYAIEQEVRRQLDSMLKLEEDTTKAGGRPNFGDADYQLAAYAAALRVLTAQPIEEINPEREILRRREPGETGPVEGLIRSAVKIACDHLVPRDFDPDIWRHLSPMERFYLKGVEVESHAEYRNGVYQELARGFGANEYTDLLASNRANETRLKSPSELGKRGLSGKGFNSSVVRHCLYAVHLVTHGGKTEPGLNWLRTELTDYWGNRPHIAHILAYLSRLEHVSDMKRWRKDGHAAALLAGAVRNDHV